MATYPSPDKLPNGLCPAVLNLKTITEYQVSGVGLYRHISGATYLRHNACWYCLESGTEDVAAKLIRAAFDDTPPPASVGYSWSDMLSRWLDGHELMEVPACQ